MPKFMCRLIFETVKWENGAPCLLPWHQRRVEAAIGVHGSDGASVPDLASVLSACPGPEGRGVYKCHITYDTRGRVRRTSFEPYRPRQVKTLTCVEMPGLDYSCKWEDRTGLLAAGAALGCDEEALILRNGMVTDTRYSNVVFGDGASCAEQKSLKMNLIFDKTLPAYLIGDVIHIKQILLNLINNAVKYTKEGQIDIKVSKNAEETKLIFEVKDTGIGIKEENLPVLFDAFMRVDSKKNKKIKGTGLGLAIAKQLAEQMDGMIWVESVYGKGSSFFVQLPMKKVSDGKISNVEWKETDERKRRSFVAPQAKILIVDDNQENLMVTRSLLKRTAVFVDTAASGEECVHKVRQNIYDLILLDYMMPQMDGIDTIRELKKDVQFHIPVIALTADVTKGIEQTFLREGFCAYLSKPVMWSKLEDLLMKYLRDDLVFIREDLKEEQKIKDEEFKQLKGQLKENDIKIEEGLRLLDGDFMQYRKLMEFFMEYQEEYMRQMQQLMTQKEVKVDEITRMMHTLKSNAKAIGAIHLYEIAKEMEDRGKQKDMEYIMSAYDLLKLEWGRVFKASREFIEQTKNILFDQKKEEEKDKQSKEEIKEKLKIFITRYQAKEAKEQIQYYRKGKISEEERNILKEMEIRIDQLDFDEAEILMKRWEGME